MSRIGFLLKRAARMDYRKMWATTDFLKERSGKSRPWLMQDMLRCAVKYNAGYMDYKIAEMYRLNDAQKRTDGFGKHILDHEYEPYPCGGKALGF